MTSFIAGLITFVMVIAGINVTIDAAILFHGYNEAANIAQVGVDAGVSQVSSIQAITSDHVNYVGNYAVSQAERAIPSSPDISYSSCRSINYSVLTCTVTYKVALPLMGLDHIFYVSRTVAAIPSPA